MQTVWQQQISLRPFGRGFHLITDLICNQLPQLRDAQMGMLNLFLQHTSASLTINENADPTVRADMERHFTRSISEDLRLYQHNYEGADDMPAHIKSSLLGVSLNIPVTQGRLALGTWQGIYLGEHRDHGGARRILATFKGC